MKAYLSSVDPGEGHKDLVVVTFPSVKVAIEEDGTVNNKCGLPR